ncbi:MULTISPECIES: DUF4349 domain-containing protein [Actinoplanes]|uniref:DUF4349 domain-containing protein n=1 Tax=Actinoplanes TaxID=1865 RepID=UPI0005F2A8DC|nr:MULTISPECIES: DUF4349 domain-containing protein [Actinoplanes]GLY03424.1 lipoprotein [Actinoplanes sp. NBRC 101535]
MRKRGAIASLGAVLLTGGLLAGCGADDAADHSSDSGSAVAPAGGKGEEATVGGAAPQAEETAGNTPADLRVDQRSIIYTGTITVRVDDVTAAAARTTGIVSTAGGFIGGDERHSDAGSASANLILRVPADKFAGVVDQVAGLGDEEGRGINTQDVTEEVVDLDARITVQQARVESGRRLLGQAKSLEDLVMLEGEVASRESDLASLQAKKRRLADLTALSTITVVLLARDAPATDDPDDDPPGFLAGLSGGWKALTASLAVLLTLLGVLLPWVLAIGLPAWGVTYLVRRYRRPAAVPPPPVAEPETTA